MTRVDLRLGRDLVMTMLGFTVFLAALMSLLTAVELTGLGAIPGQVAKGLPLLFGLATVRVALQWKASGRVVALASVGIAPVRMAVVAMVAGLFSGGVVLGVVLAAPPELKVQNQWVFVGEDVAFSGQPIDDVIVDLRVAHFDEGKVTASGRADLARWNGHWELENASGFAWRRGAHPLEWDLPDPDAMVRALRRPAEVIVTARLLAWLGAALLSGLCMSMALRGRPILGLIAAASWVPLSGLAGALVASGVTSVGVAVGGPVLCLGAVGAYASWTTA